MVWSALNNPQPDHLNVIETLIDAGAKASEDDPLRLAHAIRHLADMSPPALAEPLYDEAIAIYRSHERTPPLDLANAIRGLAALNDERSGRGLMSST